MPDWTCVDPPEPFSTGPVAIQTFWLGREAHPASPRWPNGIAARLPVAFDFHPERSAEDLDAAWSYAKEHPQQIVLVYTDQHYRGPALNDRLEGFACANLAAINAQIDCPESIAAHEVGHVLGLRHAASGLMRARAVGCTDALLDQQTLWLKQRYAPVDDGLIPDLLADSAETGAAGNGHAEPDAAPETL